MWEFCIYPVNYYYNRSGSDKRFPGLFSAQIWFLNLAQLLLARGNDYRPLILAPIMVVSRGSLEQLNSRRIWGIKCSAINCVKVGLQFYLFPKSGIFCCLILLQPGKECFSNCAHSCFSNNHIHKPTNEPLINYYKWLLYDNFSSAGEASLFSNRLVLMASLKCLRHMAT